MNDCRDVRNRADPDAPGLFPPEVIVQVKALARELPASRGLPLSRMSVAEVRGAGISATISDKTAWRWLHEDAIRPWRYRCWIFPRDPDFRAKAGRLLDLCEGYWEGVPPQDEDFVLSTDEKTRIQARRRIPAPLPTASRKAMRIEHEYERQGAWAYLAAWGRAPGEDLRPLREEDRHRPVRPPHERRHDPRALSLGAPGLLDHGQWFGPSRPSLY